MIVAELIVILQKMPQDARVFLVEAQRGHFDNEVRDVIDNTNVNDPKLVGTVELDNWPRDGYL